MIRDVFEDEYRINRYIMECKSNPMMSHFKMSKRINRYIMECKWQQMRRPTQNFSELIDTLWNVNKVGDIIMYYWNDELIDTLWNVNLLRCLITDQRMLN